MIFTSRNRKKIAREMSGLRIAMSLKTFFPVYLIIIHGKKVLRPIAILKVDISRSKNFYREKIGITLTHSVGISLQNQGA